MIDDTASGRGHRRLPGGIWTTADEHSFICLPRYEDDHLSAASDREHLVATSRGALSTSCCPFSGAQRVPRRPGPSREQNSIRPPRRRAWRRAAPTASVATERGQLEIAATLLGGAHDRALAAELEVDLGQLEAVGRPDKRFDARLAAARCRAVRLTSQHVEACSTTTDAAPQLVELRDAEAIGVEDDHHGRVGTSTPTSITVVATSTSSSPGAEHGHHRFLLGRRHLSVQQAEPQAVQLTAAQALVISCGRADLELLAISSISGHTT